MHWSACGAEDNPRPRSDVRTWGHTPGCRFLTRVARQVVYPPAPLVLNAFRVCPWSEVKVVILGQDPYHGPGQAHGLCFSVMPPTRPPPSLLNIFKEVRGARARSEGINRTWGQTLYTGRALSGGALCGDRQWMT
jgi:hypothetical protein